MGKGDQRRRVMDKHQLDEPGYYAFASVVGLQRHFNVSTAKLLAAYGFDPLSYLEHQNQPLPEHVGPANYAQWLLEDCQCPMTLLRAFLANGGDELPDYSPAAYIAAGLVATTEASLRRWADPNHFSPAHLRRSCAPEGTPLDEQALNLTDATHVVEVAQLVDFITAHPRGQLSYRPAPTLAQQLAGRFEAVAGFRLTENYATSLLALMSSRYSLTPQQSDSPPF